MKLIIIEKFYDWLGPEVKATYESIRHDRISKERTTMLLGKAVDEAESSKHDFVTLCWVVKDSEESNESSRYGAVLVDASAVPVGRVVLRGYESCMLAMVIGMEYIIENAGPIGASLAYSCINKI